MHLLHQLVVVERVQIEFAVVGHELCPLSYCNPCAPANLAWPAR
jgi:hypothetical protein